MNNNHKNSNFFISLYHALRGFYDALKSERNLRIHFCIANLICYFAYFYGINRTQWGILLLTISTVIGAELLNSAVEMAVDTATHEIRTDAMHAKDFAAAATLITAVFAVAVGISLFGNLKNILNALSHIFASPVGIGVLIVLIAIDLKVLLMKK